MIFEVLFKKKNDKKALFRFSNIKNSWVYVRSGQFFKKSWKKVKKNTLINKTSPIFRKGLFALLSIAILGLSSSVGAQETSEPAVSSEVAYILNTFLFLVCIKPGKRSL